MEVISKWACQSNKVCSNHFAAGSCSSECSIPTPFLKDFNVLWSSERLSPRKRLSETQSFLNLKEVGKFVEPG